jgi:hypothetical protein
MATFGAKTALKALQPVNYYDKARVCCTCDEKKTASMISGQTYNILNHSDRHEVYLLHARNNEHFINESGGNTNSWFEKKKRVDLDGDGVPENLDSSNVQEAMIYPPDSGKDARHLRKRQSRQLRQSEHVRDYRQFTERRDREGLKTPERPGFLAHKLPFQERLRDPVGARPTPRVVHKGEWTPRRNEKIQIACPPTEHEMFTKNVDQLRAESQMDPFEANLADAVHSARAKMSPRTSLEATATSVLSDMRTNRATVGKNGSLPPKPGAHRQQHSQNRVEPQYGTEITGWFEAHKDKQKREDPFYARPVPNMGSSCVKYDIISNERRQFWY